MSQLSILATLRCATTANEAESWKSASSHLHPTQWNLIFTFIEIWPTSPNAMNNQHFRGLGRSSRQSQPYPDPRASIGSPVSGVEGRWWATGPALKQFKEEIAPAIRKLLESSCKRPISNELWWRLYMIGRTKDTAAPTIVFLCNEEKPRKKARKLILKEGILKNYPGFRTEHMAESLVRPASGGDASPPSVMASKVYFDSSIHPRALGMPIVVKYDDGTLQRATANALYDGQKFYYASVMHVFTIGAPDTEDIAKDCDSDSEMDDDTDSEYGDDEDEVMTSRGSFSSREEGSSDLLRASSSVSASTFQSNETPIQLETAVELAPNLPRDPVARLVSYRPSRDRLIPQSSPPNESLEILGTLLQASVDQDWAIIEIINERAISFLQDEAAHQHADTHIIPEDKNTSVACHTSKGPILGHLLESPTFMRLPGSLKFQEVYNVEFSISLDWGDCGSGVFDTATGHLYGHVIASSESRRLGYVMAARYVLDDIRTRIGSSTIAFLGQVAVTNDATVLFERTSSLEITPRAGTLKSIVAAPTQLNEATDFREYVQRSMTLAIDDSQPEYHREFISDHALRCYLTPDRLKNYLADPLEWESIQNGYLRVFSILLYIGRKEYITSFTPHINLDDENLPFQHSKYWPQQCESFFQLFFEAQWQFCAQPLRRGKLNDARFPQQAIMPITKCTLLRKGLDWSTFVVEIHPEYDFLTVEVSIFKKTIRVT
jgi:hypothetical protein